MTENTRNIHAIDIVVPFYNEASVLTQLCEDFFAQVDDKGQPLNEAHFRVIAVNNASTDQSVNIIEKHLQENSRIPIIIIDEHEKGVVQARKTGSEYALKDMNAYPYLLHIDADNRLPKTLVWDALNHFKTKAYDILAYSGHFSTEFWQRVPRLAERYYQDVGILEFSDETRRTLGLAEEQALFSEQIFKDFIRVPNQLGLGVRKTLFKQAGAYIREYQENGEEILGEARNLWFRLDLEGAKLKHVRQPFITLNARRLLCDPVRWCGGKSYEGGMIDLRQTDSSETNDQQIAPRTGQKTDEHATLNALADTVNFSQVRRNLVKRLIIEPCVANPERIQQSPAYFEGCLLDIIQDILHWQESHEMRRYSDALPLILDLCDKYTDTIIENIHKIRQLEAA